MFSEFFKLSDDSNVLYFVFFKVGDDLGMFLVLWDYKIIYKIVL